MSRPSRVPGNTAIPALIICICFLPASLYAQEAPRFEQANLSGDAAQRRDLEDHPKPEIPKPNTSKKSAREYYYFSPEEFGSNAFFNPLQVFIEGGAPGGRSFSNFNFRAASADLFQELAHPIDAVNEYGAGKFFYREFLPHVGVGHNWVPNYLWHFVGGGFRTKQLEEYYHYHDYEYPILYAWMTMYSMHIMNEITQIEQFRDLADDKKYGERENDTVDALADLLFFDWIGKVVFSFDPVNEFASKTLHLRDWTHQSQYNPATNRLINNGQIYWMRYEVLKPVSVNFITGSTITALGLSYEVRDRHHLSMGAGQNVKTIARTPNGDLVAGSLIYNLGLYYSIDDIPLVLASYSSRDQKAMDEHWEERQKYTEIIQVNVYPGLFEFMGQRPGITMAYMRETYFLGITNGAWPAGIVFGHQQPQHY